MEFWMLGQPGLSTGLPPGGPQRLGLCPASMVSPLLEHPVNSHTEQRTFCHFSAVGTVSPSGFSGALGAQGPGGCRLLPWLPSGPCCHPTCMGPAGTCQHPLPPLGLDGLPACRAPMVSSPLGRQAFLSIGCLATVPTRDSNTTSSSSFPGTSSRETPVLSQGNQCSVDSNLPLSAG